jgi:hypothetical protein
MANNPYIGYYVNQVGSGISHYQGVRYQKGHGFFGNIWRSAILPFLKFAGKETSRAALGVAEDALTGKNIMDSAVTRFTDTGKMIGSDAIKRARGLIDQEGSGRKRKKKESPGSDPVVPKKAKKAKKTKATKTAKKTIKKKAKRKTPSVASKTSKGKVKKGAKKSKKKKEPSILDFPF